MPSANLTDEVVATARKWVDGMSDNVTNDAGFLNYLKDKGKIKKYSGGGRTVVEPILYNETGNNSVQWYTGFDTFNPQTNFEVLDGSEWEWKQLGGFIAISGRERMINRGSEQRKDFIKVRIKHIEAQLQNTFSTSLHSNGTGSGGQEVGGLQLLVADDPTTASIVGGIPQNTFPWWRNYFSPAAATTSANITGRMNTAWLNIKRNNDKPDVWIADTIMFGHYEASLQGLQQITTIAVADAGYMSYKYKGSPLIHDSECTASHMYALNTKDITLRMINSRMFEVGDKRTISNADYDVIPVFAMMTLTTGRRASHGVIIAS